MNSIFRNTGKLAVILGLSAISMVCVSCSKDDDPMSSNNMPQVSPKVALTYGTYVTNHRWGGASGLWRYSIPMEVTPTGEVYYNGKQIIMPTLSATEISWTMADGNTTNAWMEFAQGSDADFFWRDSVKVDKRCAMGWIQNPGEGKLDFRGLSTD